MKKIFAIFAFAILCAPCFAQQKKAKVPIGSFTGTGNITSFGITPQHGSRCEQKDSSGFDECLDMSFVVNLSNQTTVSFSVGVWIHGTKEFLEELDFNGRPVYQRTVAKTNIFASDWTQERADACRDAILTAMSSEDVEGIVKRGCQ